jgi:acetolactate decarboxylase
VLVNVIDGQLIGGVQLSRQRRAAFDAGVDIATAPEHETWQVSSIRALMDGRYEGDLTLAELVAHGDLGIGTVQHLDGELVVLDGRCWQITAAGAVVEPDPATATPFAVVCRFAPGAPVPLAGPLDLARLCERLDGLAPADEPVVAVRVDGRFSHLTLRSVPRQYPPYPPLTEVVTHQTTWTVPELRGSLVGFRFPAELQGLEVPGYHLHVLSDDRTAGGHVIDLVCEDGTARIDGAHDLHLELPPGIDGTDVDESAATAEAIRRVEGG